MTASRRPAIQVLFRAAALVAAALLARCTIVTVRHIPLTYDTVAWAKPSDYEFDLVFTPVAFERSFMMPLLVVWKHKSFLYQVGLSCEWPKNMTQCDTVAVEELRIIFPDQSSTDLLELDSTEQVVFAPEMPATRLATHYFADSVSIVDSAFTVHAKFSFRGDSGTCEKRVFSWRYTKEKARDVERRLY